MKNTVDLSVCLACNTNSSYNLGDKCIQNFYLGRYMVGYMVGNLVLR